ncbi:transposase [uncultured Ferrimonas sp.]|uniref:transposase n=1 Tax=uncultured Ferrimonas sp. TaxID=432640 RepID=UPI00263A36CF|nr:transposase [uncultured Ferrimonas sp.]
MPRARKHQISLQDTPYYHCVSRCVRRSFLCGIDSYTGKSYEHRRDWIEQRLLALTDTFAIEICAYAIMSNHSHVVLHVDAARAKQWDAEAVLNRWHQMFAGTRLTQLYCVEEERENLSSGELHQVERLVELYRERLTDISWFMRSLNEYIARQANKEDGCTGRFWEGRFKSQALLDEQALLSCMAYVDLNPIRAQMAKTPEESKYTSIRQRIKAAIKGAQPTKLKPFDANQGEPEQLPCHLNQYLDLIEFTGRAIRANKAGHIPANCDALLTRLEIDVASWLELTQGFEHQFSGLVGRLTALQCCRQHDNSQRIRGSGNAKRLFG